VARRPGRIGRRRGGRGRAFGAVVPALLAGVAVLSTPSAGAATKSGSATTVATTPRAPTTTTALAGPASWPALSNGESYGVDVSSYQGQISWTAAAQAGVTFAYIKATQGSTYVNPYFQAQWAGAQAAGLQVGAYAFFSLCSSGASQAQTFLSTVPSDPAALPPAVDLELQGNCVNRPKTKVVADQLGTFVSTVEKATGRKMILYVGWDFGFWYRKLGILQHRPLWINDGPFPNGRTPVVIWQSPDPTQVSGITDQVDLDIARLDSLRTD
jgi:lysozyme